MTMKTFITDIDIDAIDEIRYDSIIDDFLDEEDTTPMLLMTAQEQLNASESIAGFAATARSLTRSETKHWTERLDFELEGVNILDGVEDA